MLMKISVLTLLSFLLFSYTNCRPTPLVMEESNVSRGPASDSVDAFSKSVYPITRMNCIGCHTMQQPAHAHDDVQEAHDSLISMAKVDFRNIPASRIVLKLREDNHNCWSDCDQNADEMEAAIEVWSRSVVIPGERPGETTGGTSGGTTGGTGGGTTGGTPLTSLQAYTANVYPISRANCIGCHTSQSPQHASNTPQSAHDYTLNIVNFNSPASSRIITKVLSEHNCGSSSNCANIADQFLMGIVEWKKARDGGAGTTTGGSTTGGTTTGGTTTGGTTTGGTTTGGTTGTQTTSLQAYTTHMYPISRTNCIGCHTTQSPRHASNTVQSAHDASVTVVNFTTPANSKIISMVKSGHNCGNSTNCTNIANQFLAAIGEWKKAREGGSTTGGTTTAGTTTGGTTTGGTTTGGSTTGGGAESSVSVFQTTVYPITRANCMGCHTSQSPKHAASDVNTAHTGALNAVNFTTVSNSKLVTQMNKRHNCGTATNCTNLASEFTRAINEWKTRTGR